MTDDHPHLTTYTCNACGEGTSCECSTEERIPPTRCCMQYIPRWTREAME